MNYLGFPYAAILEAMQEADQAEIALIATTLGSGSDPNLEPWFHEAVQGRYREFTRPGLPDGPQNHEPYLLHLLC